MQNVTKYDTTVAQIVFLTASYWTLVNVAFRMKTLAKNVVLAGGLIKPIFFPYQVFLFLL